MKEICSYKKIHPKLHLVILKDEELQAVRKASKLYHAHLPENNTNRAILSLSVSSEEAGILRIVAGRAGSTMSAWLREAAIQKAFSDEMTVNRPPDKTEIELKAGELLSAFLG